MSAAISEADVPHQSKTSATVPVDGLARRLGITLLLVAAATMVAFVVDHLIAAPNLTLIFVLPVVAAAIFFDWTSALVAAMVGVLAFDFFFTEPYYSFRIASPSDLWAASVLLVTGTIVSAIAAESRRRALEARRGFDRAETLRALARTVIEGRSRREVVRAAADALHRIFKAPAVIFVEEAGVLAPHPAGKPDLSHATMDAAPGALSSQLHIRGETYPYDQSCFDFWPVTTPGGTRLVLGVDFSRSDEDRSRSPEQFVEVVAGYLAAVGPARS